MIVLKNFVNLDDIIDYVCALSKLTKGDLWYKIILYCHKVGKGGGKV
jgi:hypothetical protein